jgi:hypothetical protein
MTAFDEIFKNISTTIVLKMGDDIKNAFFRIYRRDDTFLTSYIGTYVYYRLRKIVTIISEATATNSFREKPFTTEELSKDIYMAFELNVYQNFDINDGDASPSAATSSREDDIQAFRRSQQQESKRTEGDK